VVVETSFAINKSYRSVSTCAIERNKKPLLVGRVHSKYNYSFYNSSKFFLKIE